MAIGLLAGRTRSIPAFYEGQNASGSPDHYVSKDHANLLKGNGSARPINRGRAILIKGRRHEHPTHRDSIKGGWKVVHQTSKKSPLRPGFPRYNTVK